jgi:hypothetical protein
LNVINGPLGDAQVYAELAAVLSTACGALFLRKKAPVSLPTRNLPVKRAGAPGTGISTKSVPDGLPACTDLALVCEAKHD